MCLYIFKHPRVRARTCRQRTHTACRPCLPTSLGAWRTCCARAQCSTCTPSGAGRCTTTRDRCTSRSRLTTVRRPITQTWWRVSRALAAGPRRRAVVLKLPTYVSSAQWEALHALPGVRAWAFARWCCEMSLLCVGIASALENSVLRGLLLASTAVLCAGLQALPGVRVWAFARWDCVDKFTVRRDSKCTRKQCLAQATSCKHGCTLCGAARARKNQT